jgi:hypothetical protein
MTKEAVIKYLEKRGMDPRQRVKRDHGGQFLDNFLVEFAREVKERTINQTISVIKQQKY